MAKGAANSNNMNRLHDKLARVFIRVLDGYDKKLDMLSELDVNNIEDGLIEAPLTEPTPAMLSAVSKFLKDNDISYDDGAVEELSAVQQRLDARKKSRGNVVSLTDLRAVEGDITYG